jgi:two-component system sensor histidine kinase VicK
MDRLVKDLLMLSALDSQKAAEMSPLLLDELIVEVMDRLLVSAHQNEQRLSSQLPEELPWVLGNRDQLEQVLVNILSNAIKYTPAGGEITVSLRTEQQKVVVEVADSGIGIPAAELPRLFERFYRVDKARSREMGGTGLGLPIAKEIVENHHGEIWVESEIGRGTRVCFALPIAATSKGGRVSA